MLFLHFAADCTLRRTNDGGEERDTDDRSRGRRGLRFVYLVTSQRFPQTSTLAAAQAPGPGSTLSSLSLCL